MTKIVLGNRACPFAEKVAGRPALCMMTSNVFGSIRPAADNNSLRVSSSVRVTSAVYGDGGRLQQVVWNLLTNAVTFTPSGGVISADAAEQDGHVRIIVSDSGEGIPAQFQSLFEPFSQADASFARPDGGLGLGLAIVKRLVEAHGGQVETDSRGQNQESTSTVTLPLGQCGPSEAPRSSGGPVVDFRGCRIVVVEDAPDSAELTKTLLEDAGASVVVCARAREALDVVKRGEFEVLVADIGCRVKTASGSFSKFAACRACTTEAFRPSP